MLKTKYKNFFDIDGLISDIQGYMPKFDRERFKKAFEFAAQAHDGQMRKDEITPYIAHPVSVVSILKGYHAEEDILISALLHDVPEDTEHTVEEIKEMFGPKVAFLVEGITKLSKVHYKHHMKEREVKSLKKLFLHSAKDSRVILIKLADRLHNMRTLSNIDKPEKRLRIATETLEIYVPIANMLGIRGLKSELEDLCFRYIFPTEYRSLSAGTEKDQRKNKKCVDSIVSSLTKAFSNEHLKAQITEKEKNLYSIYKKLSARGKSIEDVENRISLKIVVDEIVDCYRALGVVHSQFTPKTKKFKDYIANPKKNGYRSLHTMIFGPDGVPTEIQIRTKNMDYDAGIRRYVAFFQNRREEVNSDERWEWTNKILDADKTVKNNQDFLDNIKADFFEDRIVAFTPKGLSIDLPKGASCIDLAYAVHTDVGNHALKANVNGKIVSITYILSTGDVVRIITSKNASPQLYWLPFARTTVAKNRIKACLKRLNRKKKVKQGRALLQKEFDINKLGFVNKLNFKKLSKGLKEQPSRDFKTIEDVFCAIGDGSLMTEDVIKVLKLNSKGFGKKNLAKHTVTLKIGSDNRFGMMNEINSIVYKHASDVIYFKGAASLNKKEAIFKTKITLDDLGHLRKLVAELEQINGIHYTYRLRSGGYALTVAYTIATLIIWLVHPFFLNALSDFPILANNTFYATLAINISLFVLMFMVLYSARTMKKFFPVMRRKLVTWIVSFSIPALAFLFLSIEIFYFDLQLNWTTVIIEIAMVYAYLGFSFLNFKKYYLD